MTPTEDACVEAMAATGSMKLTKRMVREIASSISEELPAGFPKEVLRGMSTAAHATTFDVTTYHATFIKILQQHQEFDRGTNQNNSIDLLRKNINIVTMPMRDVLLRRFRKT